MIGLAIAVASARFVASLLYGIEVTDPVTLSAVAVLFGAVSLVACWLPARRAVQLDPVVILRGE